MDSSDDEGMPVVLETVLDLEAESKLTSTLSPTQDAFLFRANRRSALIASKVIDEGGELNHDITNDLLYSLQKEGSKFYAISSFDGLLLKRHINILKKLVEDPGFYKKIKRFQKPLCHRGAEALIRNALGIGSRVILEKDIRRAVLSACLTLLRQNVGSCFATAPAILIHEEQLENMLADFQELLFTGKLKRTFAGVEHSVPLSPHLSGDVTEHPLLKAWEFTLASFSEIKMEFSKWNLYASLGFDASQKDGLGEVIYRYLQEKLEEGDRKMQEAHAQYVMAADQVRAAEGLLRHAGSDAEARRLQAEYQSHYYHMQSCLELRNAVHSRTAHYPQFFNFLIDQYSAKFPEYFQEIYDAEMREVRGGQFDDSPAGFRLVYKYGRSDASVWKMVQNADEWIDVLIDFFRAVEFQVMGNCQSEQAEEDVREITTVIINHLRTKFFLESALKRSSRGELEAGTKKPWAYLSGGAMDILIMTYYRNENELNRESRTVESPMDLLIFLIETLKGLPPRVTDPFLKDPNKRMLMQSPTHAFILQPGWDLFKQGWQDNGFTYSWVRDEFIGPREQFNRASVLSPEEQSHLIDRLLERLSPLEAHKCRKYFHSFYGQMPIHVFREEVVLSGVDPVMLDHFLYSALPLTPYADAFQRLEDLTLKKIKWIPPDYEFITRQELEMAAVERLAVTATSSDVWEQVAQQSAVVGLAPPRPLLFADANWAGCYFGFVVNPGTQGLELWRMDRTGASGFPMTSWKAFMDGSTKLPWVVFTHPYQYYNDLGLK